jgi:signal transduction histidine kinase
VFSLATSSLVLIILLAETTRLYVSLARSNAMLTRKRDNKLMTLQAMASSISHEIRQPLATIMMNSEAALLNLNRQSSDREQMQQVLLGDVISDCRRVSETLQSVLALFGALNENHEAINLNDLALEALQNFRTELNAADVRTLMRLESRLPLVLGHKGQLREVLANLIYNALEAMQPSGHVPRILEIRTVLDGEDAVALEVEDNGPGVDPVVLPKIFDAFVTTKPCGMGLGLAICQTIAEHHGGQISASVVEPQGTMFRIVLPSQRPGAPD